jgi:HK97 family phage prohead protease
MSMCAKSNTPATCYGAICAGRKAGDADLQSSWALPHHRHPGSPPNAGAVRAAQSVLGGGRGGVMGLTNRAAAVAHMQAHMDAISPPESASTPRASRQMEAYTPQPYSVDDDDSVLCEQCHKLNGGDAQFCDQCGAALTTVPDDYEQGPDETVQCNQCHMFNSPDARYCDQCGTSLAGASLNVLGRAARRRPPRENLVRGVWPLELRDAGNGMPTLHGHFAVFNDWTHIESQWEGDFMERIAPGAFRKTFADNRGAMRVLFNHGKDPLAGDKPLGPIDVLEEDERGAYYEVPLLDTSYNRDLLPGLRAGLYGASFRFRVVTEDVTKRPRSSGRNPDAVPERTIREAEVMEFGPVTFPAYSGATASVRSLTDEFILRTLVGNPDQLRRLLEQHGQPALAPRTAPEHPGPSRPVAHRHYSLDEFFDALET